LKEDERATGGGKRGPISRVREYASVFISCIGLVVVVIYMIVEFLEHGSFTHYLQHLTQPSLIFYHFMVFLSIPTFMLIGYFYQKQKILTENLEQIIEERTKRLHEEQMRLMNIFAASPDAIMVVDLNGKVIECNQATLDLVGYSSKDEAIGKNVFEFFTEKDNKRAMENMKKTFEQGSTRDIEYKIINKDGCEFPIELSASVLRDASGNPTGFVGIIKNITERKRMEEEIKRLNEFRGLVLGSISDAVMVINPKDYTIIMANKAALRQLRMEEGEVVGKTCYEITHHRSTPCSSPHDVCPIYRMLKTEEPKVVEHIHYNEEGDKVYVETSASPIKDEKGNIVYAVHVSRDITERKRMEEKQQKSEEKYRSLVKNVKLGVFRSTPGLSGKFLEVNPAMEEITGYSRDELLSMNVSDLYVRPEEREEVLKEIESAKGKTTKELNFRKKDGTEIMVSDTKFAVRDDNGKVLYFDGIIEDITERKKAENALRESEEKLRRVLDSSPDAILVSDLNGNITDGNQAALDLFGYSSKDEIIGKSAFEGFAKKDHERAMENLKKLLERGLMKNIEYTLLTKDGHGFQGELSASVIRDASGNPTGLVGIIKDITERKRIEEMKSTFVTKVTHELKTPITTIKGCASYLRSMDSGLTEDARKMLEIVERNSDRLLKLTNDLLGLRMIEEGKFELKRESVNVAKILKESMQEVSILISKKNQKLVIGIPEDLPTISGDTTRIGQVVYNLLDNASKFTPDGGCITVRAKKYDDKILVEVSDTGIGIKKEDLRKVFDLFSDIKKPDYFKGVGIGLNICKEIIQMHGGKIWAESEGEGKGSRFIFTLPIIR